MKITVYSLEGCSLCETLKTGLNKMSLFFTNIECNRESPVCDSIENITNCDTYPIIKIQNDHRESLILCIAKDHDQLGNKFKHQDSIIFYVHSINNMLDAIKKM